MDNNTIENGLNNEMTSDLRGDNKGRSKPAFKRKSRKRKYKEKFNNRVKTFGKQVVPVKDLGLEVGAKRSNNFALIDKRYSVEAEILPGLVSYRRPIIGEISLAISPSKQRLENTIKQSIYRWIETVGYHELRSGKSILGMTASEPISNIAGAVSKFISYRILKILLKVIEEDSFPLYMERIGMNSITIPKFLYDMLHYVVSLKRTHRLDTNDQSMIKIDLFTNLSFKEDLDKLSEESKYNPKDLGFKDALYDLSFIITQMKFSDSVTITNFSELNYASPHLCNCFLLNSEATGNKDFLNIMTSYNSTQKDVALVLLLGIWYKGTTLPNGCIDEFKYYIEKSYVGSSLTTFFINEYLNISDSVSIPQQNTPLDETFDFVSSDKDIIGNRK